MGAVSSVVVLAGGSQLASERRASKRVARGLRLLREWLRRNPGFFYLRPGSIARDLGLGHGAAVSIGHALRYWERVGLVARDREDRARYVPLPRLIYLLETRGCLAYRECPTDAPCGLIGTMECPFLVGVAEA